MARSIPALVKPELLVWARESAGYSSLESAAEAMDIHPLTLEEWENGHVAPSVPELRKLGEFYKRRELRRHSFCWRCAGRFFAAKLRSSCTV